MSFFNVTTTLKFNVVTTSLINLEQTLTDGVNLNVQQQYMSPKGCGKVRSDLTLPQPSTNVVITLCASWVEIKESAERKSAGLEGLIYGIDDDAAEYLHELAATSGCTHVNFPLRIKFNR